MHGAHLSDAQQFDWLGVQVVHMRHVGKRTNVMHIPPRSHRGAGIFALSRGLTYPDRLVTVRIRRDPPPLAIRAHAHLQLAQRFTSFAPQLPTYEG
ncbi:hypothetical protein C7S15_0232 [Burkholderia cepacia]|nr:hypothetical protein [Burkholderia cepacia]